MINDQKGMSLVEILISLVISSIIIAASFASYVVISRNFDFQKEMKNIAQSSRAVVEIIKRDVRLGGFVYDGNTAISEPIKITDGGASASDRIDIIYDQDKNTRLKISYYTVTVKPMTAFERRRLMKTVIQCTVAQCGSGNTVMSPQPIADYVEDLQFTGFKNGSALGNGSVAYGQGNLRAIVPVNVTTNCSNNNGVNKAIDGSTTISTFYQCSDNSNFTWLKFDFDKQVRITKIFLETAAGVNGGSLGAQIVRPFNNATYPYGVNQHIQSGFQFMIGPNYFVNKRPECASDQGPTSCVNYNSGSGTIGQDKHFDAICAGVSGIVDAGSKSASGGCTSNNVQFNVLKEWAVDQFRLQLGNENFKCTYTQLGQKCNPTHRQTGPNYLGEIRFYGEVFGEPQNPQEVEIGLLMRSANEYGSTPIQKTYNIGNRSIVTNDNYIRDTYFTSTLIRNVYYGL